MYRNTYIEVNLKNIEYNVKKVIETYPSFHYYFGVVKADCYGHGALASTDYIIKGGANYLAVATLEEALEIRTKYKKIPILCLGMINNSDIEKAIKNKITITILNKEYLNQMNINQLQKTKIHIKINTGMNRLGVSTKEEFNEVYHLLIKNKIDIEGIYSHIHSSDNEKLTNRQFDLFEKITSDIDLSQIKIVHIQASDAITKYKKRKYINGARLGIIMYGFTKLNTLKLKSTFKLYSNIIQIHTLKSFDTVGYNAKYKVRKKEKIAIVPIGYADGIIRKNTNRYVYIKNKQYRIVGNICMDMLFIKIDDDIHLFDQVELIKDNLHIQEIAKHLDTIPYEVLCSISKRVPRIYSK